jgi:hypothetical protein
MDGKRHHHVKQSVLGSGQNCMFSFLCGNWIYACKYIILYTHKITERERYDVISASVEGATGRR